MVCCMVCCMACCVVLKRRYVHGICACIACALRAPVQMNTAKWPFSVEEDELNVVVDVALPLFLDSAAVRHVVSHDMARHGTA